MSLFEIFLTAVSLSLDAVAVAIAASALGRLSNKEALKIAAFFGGFQLVMPLIGWGLGLGFENYALTYGRPIGFALLLGLGLKMLVEVFKEQDEPAEKNITNLKVLTILAVATSVDALVIGITFNFLPVSIPSAVTIIGLVTFILCILGIYIGRHGKQFFGNKIEAVGALILIGLAFKVLLY